MLQVRPGGAQAAERQADQPDGGVARQRAWTSLPRSAAARARSAKPSAEARSARPKWKVISPYSAATRCDVSPDRSHSSATRAYACRVRVHSRPARRPAHSRTRAVVGFLAVTIRAGGQAGQEVQPLRELRDRLPHGRALERLLARSQPVWHRLGRELRGRVMPGHDFGLGREDLGEALLQGPGDAGV